MKRSLVMGAFVVAAFAIVLLLILSISGGQPMGFAGDAEQVNERPHGSAKPSNELGGSAERAEGPHRPQLPTRRQPHSSVAGNFQAPSGNAVDVIAALRPMAEAGDKEAALNIYLKANECRMATKAAIRSAPNTDPSALIPQDCIGLTSVSYREAAKWLEAAAESGSEYAQLLYATSTDGVLGPPSEWIKHPEEVQAYKQKTMRYLHAAAENGSVEAWQALSSAYANGVLIRQDNLKAYAYYRAAGMVDPNSAGPKHLEQLRKRLSVNEMHQAEAQSRRVYEGKN